MFKRNGQLCEHTVPDYSGRLTDAEFLAYNSVFGAVENHFNDLSSITTALGELEKSFPRLLNAASAPLEKAGESIEGPNGSQWDVLAPLVKMQGSEMLWCKRRGEGADEFAVVQRLDPDSPLAKAQGACDVQMTSNDAQTLLRDFIQAQREALGLFAIDIVADAQEKTAEKYPGKNMDRVVKAVEARCAKKISSEQTTAPVQALSQREGMHI